MAHTHLVAALATATTLLLITFHLISTFGLPRLDILHLHYVSEGVDQTSSEQIPISPPPDFQDTLNAPDYLLGVGKADITGFVRITCFLSDELSLHIQACRRN